METPQNKTGNRELYGINAYKPIEEEILLRPFSRRLAKILAKTKIHPDQVSWTGFLLTMAISLWLFYFKIMNPIILVLSLYIVNILDKTDGDLARLKNIADRRGQYLDGFLDALGDIILISAWASAFGRETEIFLVGISVAFPILFYYHSISAPFYLDIAPKTHSEQKPEPWQTIFYWGRAKFFLLLIVGSIFQKPELVFWILPIVGLYTFLIFIKNIFTGKIKR